MKRMIGFFGAISANKTRLPSIRAPRNRLRSATAEIAGKVQTFDCNLYHRDVFDNAGTSARKGATQLGRTTRTSVQEVRAIQGIALHRPEAGVADHAP